MSLSDSVPSAAFDVLQRNAEDLDKLVNGSSAVTNRVGDQLTPVSVLLQGLGYIDKGTFTAGATLTTANDILQSSGEYYRWTGALPKTVTGGSSPTPAGVGGWVSVGDSSLRGDLGSPSSTVPVGNFQARYLGNIQGNSSRAHFSIGAIPRCKTDGVFELINDTVHNPMNVTSVTQPDQYTIRINYSKTATKINSFIAAPDAELAPFGVVCGGDVGTSYANIQAYAPLNFIADNNSTPSITLNALWQPSYASGSITATKLSASTLRVTHPPVTSGDSPVVTTVNASRPCEYVVSFGSTQVDVVCVGQAKGYISYSGSAWSQAFSENVTAPTLTWTASNTLKIDHGVAYSGSVVPVLTGHGGAYIPQVVNYGSTFIEVAFYDYTGTKVTTQGTGMQFWYTLDGLKVPCNWPTGNIVSVQRGMVHVPSYNFKGVTGNNLWVSGDFEYA